MRSSSGSVGLVGVGALLVSLAGPVAGQVTERVSVSSSGVQGDQRSFYCTISADGRYVAFSSDATNLVSGDANGARDVFVRDRQSGATERVNVSSSGVATFFYSSYPDSISADGRYVVFETKSPNLVSGDTNGFTDVFVRDRQSGTTERVSVSSSGVQGNNASGGGSITSDGRYVAFISQASNLVSGDTNGAPDIFVRDRQSGTTERVSVDSSGAQGNGGSNAPSISADGRYVAFEGDCTNLVSGDTNGVFDVFVRDRVNGTTERVSVDSSGTQASAFPSSDASISADGRYVSFESGAGNLVGGDTNGAMDVFVHDRLTGTTERVSVDSSGAQGDGDSVHASISADARYVTFESVATNLVSGDTNGATDVFVHDRLSGTTELVSVDSSGSQGNGTSYSTSYSRSISADGRYVAFYSDATNLVSGDTNGASDVFARVRCLDATSAVFSGDGLNADTIAPVSAILGSSWSAPLTIGHAHGTGGPLLLTVRSVTINGPNFHSPLGGRLTEVLVGGPPLASLTGSHNGVSGDVPAQTIPAQSSLAGLAWAAQYTVVGGGFGDLSLAVSGTIGCH